MYRVNDIRLKFTRDKIAVFELNMPVKAIHLKFKLLTQKCKKLM